MSPVITYFNPNISVDPTECHCLIYPGLGSWPDGDHQVIDLEYGFPLKAFVTYTKNGPLHEYNAVPFILNMTPNSKPNMRYFNESGEYSDLALNTTGHLGFYPGKYSNFLLTCIQSIQYIFQIRP